MARVCAGVEREEEAGEVVIEVVRPEGGSWVGGMICVPSLPLAPTTTDDEAGDEAAGDDATTERRVERVDETDERRRAEDDEDR